MSYRVAWFDCDPPNSWESRWIAEAVADAGGGLFRPATNHKSAGSIRAVDESVEGRIGYRDGRVVWAARRTRDDTHRRQGEAPTMFFALPQLLGALFELRTQWLVSKHRDVCSPWFNPSDPPPRQEYCKSVVPTPNGREVTR